MTRTLLRSRRRPALALAACLLGGLALLAPRATEAFCGFYVAGADASLYNDATMVVLMRDGQRTVLSMQNDYQGPPENFALVIPVPVVLQEDNVKILPADVFDRVDQLAAPRLVEYWEQDPCYVPDPTDDGALERNMVPSPTSVPAGVSGGGVVVEAEFEVGEYQIVILSASDSTGLDTWLRSNGYNIPEGAEPLLRPYVEGGSKFFVAKVDVSKVKFESRPNGEKSAMLSPLRFHYDSDQFNLPVRLGLINANGPQDLLVHILAPKQRYEAANYENVTIPTNLIVKDQTREHFGQFYVSLFDHTLAQQPGAVVTEYAWSASGCDPCPVPALELDELVTLGAGLLPRYAQHFEAGGDKLLPEAADQRWTISREFVLTRLHARYDAQSLGEDLVFQAAAGMIGGRGVPNRDGQLEPEVRDGQPPGSSAFQARYAILHPWEGKIDCDEPQRGRWGGPPRSLDEQAQPTVARELAFVTRGAQLGSYLSPSAGVTLGVADVPPVAEPEPEPEPEPESKKDDAEDASKPETDDAKPGKQGCKCAAQPDAPAGLASTGLALLALLGLRRRRDSQTIEPRS